jgi:hypothetical protein
MPKHWLTEVEILCLTSFPEGMPEAGVITDFTLTESDRGLLISLLRVQLSSCAAALA